MMSSIAWFARNGVAANLLMALVLWGGFLALFKIKREVFPEFSLDLITVSAAYPGAAPEEVEEGVCVRVEEAIQGLDGVKKITSTANEGMGQVAIELNAGADARRVLDDVKSRVDAIDTFPEETEEPVVRQLTNRRQVINVAMAGDVGETTLKAVAEQVRDEITLLPGITQVELASARPYEISIEVSESDLRRYQLTFSAVADAIRRSSLDLPGGSVKTGGGEILLRTKGQAYRRGEFEKLVLFTRSDGTHLLLGDVARVVDGFADSDQSSRFDGEPAMVVEVFRSGEQNALAISQAVHRYVQEARRRLPAGVHLTTWQDSAELLRSRLDLMIRNGRSGFILVFITLALFLRFRLAIWVVLGVLMAFLGSLWLMPLLGVSINLVSLFGFILVLGIVVDDAIVMGESIYTIQEKTGQGLEGAIEGARQVYVPVVFAVLTTVAAFLPLIGVPGSTGKFLRVIPFIVIPCLLWSLVESVWILPAHLSHFRARDPGRRKGPWDRFQDRFASGLSWVVEQVYSRSLAWALEWRYLTLAIGSTVLLVTLGLVAGGAIHFVFFPHVESDFVSAALTMAPGTPAAVTSQAVHVLEESAGRLRRSLLEESGGTDLFRHTLAAIGEQPYRLSQRQNAGGFAQAEVGSNLGEVTIALTPGEDRTLGSAAIARRWRDLTGGIPDAIELDFTDSLFSPGEDINVQLMGPRVEELQQVAAVLKRRLAGYTGIHDISDSFRRGKDELKLAIRPRAEVLGLTLSDLGRQVRQAFYGEEAQRIQRGRDEVKVMVRYPENERRSLGDLEEMRVRTPDGTEVPFRQVATVVRGRGYASIKRVNRMRTINVTADVDAAQASPGAIIADLEAQVLPRVLAAHPGVQYTFEGQQAEQRETMGGLYTGFLLALALIYALLAVPLRSYTQPLIIMSAIPFGLVGAVWGHMIIGLDLTILSMFGLVALAGVVVNDSLVMVDFINRHRRTVQEKRSAVRQAGTARFRPILLTSLTTFAGLFPLMMERSMQARFLIPMAVSLAFGVLFATLITLFLVPAAYLVLEDGLLLGRRWLGRRPAVRTGKLAGGMPR
ncbi:MAG: efflux RND transporter permease subunit [Acidobacteriota bacterium]